MFSELCSSKKNQNACSFPVVGLCATLEKGRIWIKVCQVKETCATLQVCLDFCSVVCSFVNLVVSLCAIVSVRAVWFMPPEEKAYLVLLLAVKLRRGLYSLGRAAPHT